MPVLTKLSKEDLENILKNYSIGTYKSHTHVGWALQNSVYALNTTKGKYILKMFEGADEAFIGYQNRIIDYLAEKNMPVAKISKTKAKKDTIRYKGKPLVIQKFLEGSSPKKMSKPLIKDIAKKFSLMGKYLLRLKLKGKYVWQNDHEFKPDPERRGAIMGVDFKSEEQTLLRQLKDLDRKKLRRSVIHGDFHGINLLAKSQKLTAIIDWDDSHEDYLAYEIAVSFLDHFISDKGVDKKNLRLFFREYQKNLKLGEEEKKAIYHFIKRRFLSVIYWHSKQMGIHKDLKKRLEKNQKRIINNYLTFSEISLEEFLELF